MKHDAYVLGPNGVLTPFRVKAGSGPLYNAFHGINTNKDRPYTDDPADLARAYAVAAWAYKAIKVRAEAVSVVELKLFEEDGTEIDDHALVELLKEPGTGAISFTDLMRDTESAYGIWGRAFWLIERGLPYTSGVTGALGLQWLNPQTIEVQSNRHGITGFKQTLGAQTQTFMPQDVIYFRNFDPNNDLGGLSPLSVVLSEVNAEVNAARYVAGFFANDARPSGLLTTDQHMPDAEIERAIKWWEKLFKGVTERWKTGVLGGGLKYQQISTDMKDISMPSLREEDRRAILAVYGVPPTLAGAWEAANYATAKEQKASFYEDTIIPQLLYYAGVLNWHLLPQYPDLTARNARLGFAINEIEAIQEGEDDRAARVGDLYEKGIVTLNEARFELGLDPVPDGDDFKKPAPAIPFGADPAAAQDGTDPDADNTTEADREQAAKAAYSRFAPAAPPARIDPAVKAELDQWERFALKRSGTNHRPFSPDVIPFRFAVTIQRALAKAESKSAIRHVFRMAAIKAAADELAPMPIRSMPLFEQYITPSVNDDDIQAAIEAFELWAAEAGFSGMLTPIIED